MAGKGPDRNAVAVSDLATAILDPVLRKRAGISIGLVQSWDEIVGPRLLWVVESIDRNLRRLVGNHRHAAGLVLSVLHSISVFQLDHIRT